MLSHAEGHRSTFFHIERSCKMNPACACAGMVCKTTDRRIRWKEAHSRIAWE